MLPTDVQPVQGQTSCTRYGLGVVLLLLMATAACNIAQGQVPPLKHVPPEKREWPADQVVCWDLSRDQIQALYGNGDIVQWALSDGTTIATLQLKDYKPGRDLIVLVPSLASVLRTQVTAVDKTIVSLIKITDGRELWSRTIGDDSIRAISVMASPSGAILLGYGALTDRVYCFDLADGHTIWQQDNPEYFDFLDITCSSDGRIWATVSLKHGIRTRRSDGRLLWERENQSIDDPMELPISVRAAPYLIVFEPHTRSILALEFENGREIWRHAYDNLFSMAGLSSDGQLQAYWVENILTIRRMPDDRAMHLAWDNGPPEVRFTPDGKLAVALPVLRATNSSRSNTTEMRRASSSAAVFSTRDGTFVRNINLSHGAPASKPARGRSP